MERSLARKPDSPIERMLLDALVRFAPENVALYTVVGCDSILWRRDGVFEITVDGLRVKPPVVIGKRSIGVVHDVTVGSYRLDFAVAYWSYPGWWIGIECDGHEWHERTKQQAAADRARDRELLRLGLPTMRFTGSEIFHDSDRCASEVYAISDALLWTRGGYEFALYDKGYVHGYEDRAREITASAASASGLLLPEMF